jgi:uncharacterized membrane protein
LVSFEGSIFNSNGNASVSVLLHFIQEENMVQPILFVHILAAFLLVAGSVGSLATSLSARRTSSSSTILALMKLQHKLTGTLILPGSSIVLLSGLYLTYALGLSWTSFWIAGALAAWVLALLLGGIVLGPSVDKVVKEAERCIDHGETQVSPELRSRLESTKFVIGEWAEKGLILLLIYFMVFKP